jgi:hypothetical protein
LGASVVIEPSCSVAGRGGRRCGDSRLFFFPHDPEHAAAADPNAVEHPQPRPDLAVALAAPRRTIQIPADGGEQVGIAQHRFRATPAGRSSG